MNLDWTKKIKNNNTNGSTKCKYELASTKIPIDDLVLSGETEEIINETSTNASNSRRRQTIKDTKTSSHIANKLISSNDSILAIDADTETDSLMSKNITNENYKNIDSKYNPNDNYCSNVNESKF